VDVTPRRLQHFHVTPLTPYAWSVRRLVDNTLMTSGTVTADTLGHVTVPAVKVLRAGSLLRINVPGAAGVHLPARPSGPLTLTLDRSPVRDHAELAVQWPLAGEGAIELFDAAGRRVATPFRGTASGVMRVPLDARDLPTGLYLARASQRAARTVARVVVVH
jgi:hypothetical protein